MIEPAAGDVRAGQQKKVHNPVDLSWSEKAQKQGVVDILEAGALFMDIQASMKCRGARQVLADLGRSPASRRPDIASVASLSAPQQGFPVRTRA